jgi:hypothetical protein
MILAFGFPSPNTVWVAVLQRSQALQPSACLRKRLVVVAFLDTGKPLVSSVGLALRPLRDERFMVAMEPGRGGLPQLVTRSLDENWGNGVHFKD